MLFEHHLLNHLLDVGGGFLLLAAVNDVPHCLVGQCYFLPDVVAILPSAFHKLDLLLQPLLPLYPSAIADNPQPPGSSRLHWDIRMDWETISDLRTVI